MSRPLPANLINVIGERANLANLIIPSRSTTTTDSIHKIHQSIKLGRLDEIKEILEAEPTSIDSRNKVCIHCLIRIRLVRRY